jgi:lipopolysaccharide transport system ATP-binding protein
MAPVIIAQNLSKVYQIGEFSTGSLTQDIERWWLRMRGKEDPFMKIEETNDRSVYSKSEFVWSLRDLNFEIEQGDAVGIIGRNGAGKSTLLKLLSRVTTPTTGSIKVKGRIASLLEVGTGFHPELTGRENIFLNGAILGMRKKEILKKFDEIVNFSGVQRYIDTPVKRYSSGMYVRLAFAVAAHLESEILIVDEVLAVGDAEFQKKCIDKMHNVTKNEGRTVLFVSHNLSAMLQLCNNGILLKNGELINAGEIQSVINVYSANDNSVDGTFVNETSSEGKKIFIRKIQISDRQGEYKLEFNQADEILIRISLDLNEYVQDSSLFITVLDSLKRRVFSAECPIDKNKSIYTLTMEKEFLTKGVYTVHAFTHLPGILRFDEVEDVCQFAIIDLGSEFVKHGGYDHGVVFGRYNWE